MLDGWRSPDRSEWIARARLRVASERSPSRYFATLPPASKRTECAKRTWSRSRYASPTRGSWLTTGQPDRLQPASTLVIVAGPANLDFLVEVEAWGAKLQRSAATTNHPLDVATNLRFPLEGEHTPPNAWRGDKRNLLDNEEE